MSEIMMTGSDLRLAKRRKACRNDSSVRSGTTSKCTALVDAHVNKQTYTFFSCPTSFFTYMAPVKSTPVTVKGGESLSLHLGSGGGSGELKGLDAILRQITHFRTMDFTVCRMHGIQNLCRR